MLVDIMPRNILKERIKSVKGIKEEGLAVT
jgi:hypothetical protein